MKKIFYIAFILLLGGCAYRSNIIRGGSGNNIYLVQDTIQAFSGKSILTNPVNLDFLKRIDGNSDHGSFNIFIATDNLYIEAKSQFLSKDSLSVSGVILSNFKQDTLHFNLKYKKQVKPINLNKISQNDYSFKLEKTFDKNFINNSDSTTTFYLRKTQNFIIQDNILELLTGEGQRQKGNKFKFIIINDPANPDYYLTTIGLLDAAFLSEKEYSSYVSQCKNQQIVNCKKGYDIDLIYNWYEFYVKCKCLNEQ